MGRLNLEKIITPGVIQQIEKQAGFLFQRRDEAILTAIQEFDGVLARRQLKYLFWRRSSWRAMEKRLAKLHQNGYIAWPNLYQRKHFPIPEPIVWLNWKGARYLSGRQGIEVPLTNSINENKLRYLDRALRENGFYWLREPRWNQLTHDLMIIDIRLWINDSLGIQSTLVLEEWIKESTFKSDTDHINFQYKTRDGKIISKRKGICPDGMFILADLQRKKLGQPFRVRYLVEVDKATHDNPSFGIDKAVAGNAYIKSKQYQKRFGNNLGCWLVLTTGNTRMKNLIYQTQERVGENSSIFFFTTFDRMRGNNFFGSPIWFQANSAEPKILLPEYGSYSKGR